MPSAPQLLDVLSYLQLAGQLLLVAHLVRSGLRGAYQSFLFLLLASSVREAVLLAVSSRDLSLYGVLYVASAPVIWLGYILTTLEIYGRVLRGYPGIASVARWVLVAVAPVSVLGSLASLLPEMAESARKYFWLMAESMITRAVCGSILAFLLLISVFLVWCPVRVARNTVRHAFLLSVLLLVQTAALLIRDSGGYALNPWLNVVFGVSGLILVLAWLALLQPAGEQGAVVVRPRFGAEDERRLLQQLDSINATLSRSTRK
ncbi:MAG TPA: hypothetical protein DEH78_11010 [Solibacterales bacterium]|nr:hypothetical protein [Bryobacterales bacterium]